MLLAEIKKGQQAEITAVQASDFREKLLEMGCVPGARVSLALRAPLGDPCAYMIDGYCLSMRKKEARLIEVKIITGE
ncbi:MAG: ferrous iron transport protein A [Bacteroidia bacterium]|nr:ferrous iron transport protein A [Bacteroidia bacterium]